VPEPPLTASPPPLNVTIVDATPTPAAAPVEATPPPPQPRPPPTRPPVIASRKPAPQAPPEPTVEPPPPAPIPAPTPPPPQFDMRAMIDARRARQRAADAAAARGAPSPDTANADPGQDSINRNLRSLGPGKEEVGGVFEILGKSTLSGSFGFNGWRPESRKQWREVIEVTVSPGEDIERAMVRRMIQLIRSHYTGDFNWHSHRLDRVVVLSARPEDNEQLENYLMREFFGTPVLNRPR
jgi:hypothetical protein